MGSVGGPLAESSEVPQAQAGSVPLCVDPADRSYPGFDALYEQTVERLYAYLRVRTGGNEEAADLAQQIYLQALAAWARRPGSEDALVPWLFRIARNAATDLYRRRRPVVTWEQVAERLQPISNQQPEDQALRRESVERLSVLLDLLPPAKREILALRFAAGLSYAEIGATIGKSEAASKQQILRLLYSLRDQYDER